MNYMNEIAEILVDVQTELIFFGLAFATHLLFFSKMRVPSLKAKKMVNEPAYPNLPSVPQAKNQKKASGNPCLAGLKAALRAGDAKSAMTNFEELHSMSESAAPQALMEQLVKVASQNGVLSELLHLLSKLGLLSDNLELILAESADKANAKILKEAQQLARSQGIKFS